MKNIVTKHLNEFSISINANIDLVEVLKSKELSLGHYSTNFLMKLPKEQQQENFEKLISFFSKNYSDIYEVEKIKIVGPGFVNFFFKKHFLINNVFKFLDEFFRPNFDYKKSKINYEFVSANPTGYLHVGHARNAIVGDINCRVLEYMGFDVFREYYINDAGNQINDLYLSTKWYYQNPQIIEASQAPEDIPYKGKEILKGARELKNELDKYNFVNDQDKEKIKLILVEYYLKEIKNILSEINIKPFNKYSSEKELYDSKYVDAVIEKLENSGKTFSSDGAVWLKTTDYGDDKDRVLKKSDGTFTYVMGDIAYHFKKFSGDYDILYNLWGADHKGYENRIFAGLTVLGLEPSKLNVDFINMVQIVNDDGVVKMSKRMGTSFTIRDMISELTPDLLRYFIVSKNKEQGHEINITKAKEIDMNNPYYYSQYAFARISQILAKGTFDISKLNKDIKGNLLLKDEKEEELVSKMLEFEDIIIHSYKTHEPHVILNYLKELSNNFHSYYNSIVVISDDAELTKQRIHLIYALKNLYVTVFNLLGIKPMEKM